MKKGTFEDLLPQETVESKMQSNVSVGEVFGPYYNAADNTLNSF